jgi:hypothetical protein
LFEEMLNMKLKRTAPTLPVAAAVAILAVGAVFQLASCSDAKAASGRVADGAPRERMSAGSFAADAEKAELKRAEAVPAPMEAAASARPEFSAAERKLIRSADLRLRVTDLSASEREAGTLVASFGGYVASSSRSEESLYMSLRIPGASFEAALAGIEPLGKELSRSLSSEDVTLNWYDLESRLETKRELMKTLRAYLRSAKSIEDIMTVESKLADLQNEIDSLGGQFAHLADLVDFATINAEFVLPAARVQTVEPSLGERIGDVLRGTGAFFSSLVALLVGLVVFGVPVVALAAALFWLLFGKMGLVVKLYRLVAGPKRPKSGGTPGAS